MGRCSIIVDERVAERLLREGGDPDLFKKSAPTECGMKKPVKARFWHWR